jgi:hypothetical protein
MAIRVTILLFLIILTYCFFLLGMRESRFDVAPERAYERHPAGFIAETFRKETKIWAALPVP